MKTNRFTTGLFFSLSFGLVTVFSALAQDRIKGNGKVVEKAFSVQSFNEIKIEGVFNVHLTQGNTESVKLSIDDNLLQYITVKNEGSQLVVKWEKDRQTSINNVKSDLYITFKNINELALNTVGKVSSTNTLKLNSFELDVNSVGETNLDVNCQSLDIDHNGVGSLVLEGRATRATIDCSGVGGLKAFDLIVDILKLQCSGVGSAEVTAEKEISVSASGVGGVRYRGDAKTVQLNASGIGRVKKV
jgi:hypothetical protein